MGAKSVEIVKRTVKTVVKPVLQQWPLWLTMVLTLIPMTWMAWDFHVLQKHDFPASYLLGSLVNDASVVAVLATLVAWVVNVVPGRRVVKWALYILLLALWVASLFLMRNFNTTFTPQILQLMMETNSGESSEFLHAWMGAIGTRRAIQIAAFTLLCILVAEWKRKPVADWLMRRTPMAVASVALSALLLWGLWNWRFLVRPYHSVYDLEMTQTGSHPSDLISTLHKSILTLRFQADEADAAVDCTLREVTTGDPTCDVDSMDLVLVIGESYNKRHSSLYGYGLDTSPLMQAERERGLLTVFTDVISPYNLTSITLKNLFSLNSLGDGERWNDYPMWTAVMRRAGWQVDIWDNQRAFMTNELFTASLNMYLFNPRVVNMVYRDVNEDYFDYDGLLVQDYFNKCRLGDLNLVVFHLMGQHTEYAARYPHTADWEVWTTAQLPDATAPYLDDSKRKIILDYARATRYNDYVLATIVNYFRHRNAVVVMLSDHGEEVFDYRDFMERDHNPVKTPEMVRHENDIPFMVWYSPVYKARHPERVAAIQAAAARPMMNDVVGQMMLWLGEVNSPWCDSTRNILHPAYKPSPRIIYNNIDYDQLMNR